MSIADVTDDGGTHIPPPAGWGWSALIGQAHEDIFRVMTIIAAKEPISLELVYQARESLAWLHGLGFDVTARIDISGQKPIVEVVLNPVLEWPLDASEFSI